MADIWESIFTQSCLIYEKIGNSLGVQDSFSWVIEQVDRALLETKLDSVNSVADAEPRIDDSLHGRYKLFVGRSKVWVMVSADWYE